MSLAARRLWVSRITADLDRAVAFHRDALGFTVGEAGPCAEAELLGLGAGQRVVMRLGDQRVALVRLDRPSRPYPAAARGDDRFFQHLAIVVSDIDAAHAHLARHRGWVPISRGGPQTLPPANGGVRAFKFRDPDGHPLELIWFPHGPPLDVTAGPFLRIDHSALAIGSGWANRRFFRTLGFHVAARSWNYGPAQDRLDGLDRARVRVTGLRLADGGMGLELLRYHPPGRSADGVADGDVAADWTTLAVPGLSAPCVRRSPDHHRFLLLSDTTGDPA